MKFGSKKFRSLERVTILLGTFPLLFGPAFGQESGQRPAVSHSSQEAQERTRDPQLKEADKLNKEVDSLHKTGRYAEAIPLARELLELREAVLGADHPDVAESLNNLAFLLHATADYAAARPLFERVLRIDEKTLGLDHPEVATSLQNLAGLFHAQGDYTAARPLYERALRIREKTLGSDHPHIADILNLMAFLLQREGDYAAARPLYERALRIGEKALGSDVAGSLRGLATLSQDQGDYAAARPLYERALRISEKTLGTDHPETATILNDLGGLLKAQGDYAAARLLYERALRIREKIVGSDHPNTGSILNNLAILLKDQGDYAAARPLYEQALRISEKTLGTAHPDVATSLNNLAVLLEFQGDYAAARPLYEQALRIREKALGTDHPDVADSLNNLAVLFPAQGDYAAARRLHERALQIREKALGLDHSRVALSVNNIAFLLQDEGDYAAARPLYERALRIREKSLGSNHPEVAGSLTNLAFLDWLAGELPDSRGRFLHAAQIINAHSERVFPTLSFAEQRAFLQTKVSGQVSNLLSSHRAGKPLKDAYGLLFRWKGLLIDSLRRQTAISRLGNEPSYKPKVEQLHALRAQIAGWYHKAGSVSFKEWKEKNDSLTAEKEAFERELAQAIGAGKIKDSLSDMDLHAFQAVLKNNEVFVDLYRYAFGDKGKFVEHRYGAVVTGAKEDPVLVDLGQANALEAAVASWRRDVLTVSDGEQSWQALSQLLWEPLVTAFPKGTQRVWLSPDGELARVPWHLLPATDGKSQKLLLTQTDSPRELVRLRQTRPPSLKTPSLLLAGGIEFDSGEKDIAFSEEFQPLLGTEAEVKSLKRLGDKQKLSVSLLTGKAASKDRIARDLSHATYAHLATHGFFFRDIEVPYSTRAANLRSSVVESVSNRSVRNPLVESGLALAGANVRDPLTMEAKGLLTAEEVVGLDLSRSELVALSACDTGRGEEITGQGVMGLRASVLAAGARSILMSLWKVPDEATMKLMEEFYTNLWVRKLPKAAALVRAQEAVRDHPSGEFKEPLHWAAWVLAGEGW
jgi:CHAT domain-containing protein/Tfp pilus assembly protein PilF